MCTCLLDTGSVISAVSEDFYNSNLSHVTLNSLNNLYDNIDITSATGSSLNIKGYIEVNILFPGLSYTTPILMCVLCDSILSSDMPALIGSNALECWRQELNDKYSSKCPKINPVIDSWTIEDPASIIGSVQVNGHHRPSRNQVCTFVKCTLNMKESKPYDRKVVYTPFSRYDNTLLSKTLMIPKHNKSFDIQIPALNFPNNKSRNSSNIINGRTIGTIANISHTINFPAHKTTTSTDNITREEFLSKFEKTWPADTNSEVEDLLWYHRAVFAMDHTSLGKCDVTEHVIELSDETPIRQKYRRIPPTMYESVKTEIEKLLEAGVIKPSISPWSSPISIAVKKDGTPRICLDFRQINAITKKDAKSIPQIDELFDQLHGKTIFSSLDMMQGYHQIPLSNRCKEYTAFTAGNLGFFQFERMAFGLSNATATFQRAMEHILQDLLNTIALVYIDDIIIYSKSIKEHLNSLDIVFHRLTQHGLKLKPSKCFLFKEKLNFLGHTISKEGIQKDSSKVEAIKSWKQPTTVKELRRLLGLTGFLRRYIQNYATIVAPLTDLLAGYSNKKGSRQQNKKLEQVNWKWKKEQQHAFMTLKKKICEDVVLAFANFNKPFRLSVDASRKGLGAALEQHQEDGKWRPVAFASRRTSSSEQNYPIHKLEFLALKWAITEKFACYLRTSHFDCYTDNNPLTHVFKSAKLDATSQRWVASLEPYDFSVIYRPGVNNVVADALSRQYDNEEDDNTEHFQKWAKDICTGFPVESPIPEALPAASTTISDTLDTITTSNYNWEQLQNSDDTITTVKHLINETNVNTTDATPEVKSLMKHKEKLHLFRNLLYYQDANLPKRLLVPASQQKEIIKIYHSFGHFGITRVLKLLQERFFWTNMKESVVELCASCERCQKAKTPKNWNRGPLNHIITPAKPMHQLSIDFLSIDTKAETKLKILTCVDEFTKYAFATQVKSENASKTAETLYKQIYTKFGIPEVIHSDRGATFLSKVIKELNKILAIHHTVTTAYRPQSNGTCERLNNTIINRIRTLHPREKKNWHLHLDSLLFAYNTTVHESTGISPFYGMFGRQAKIPLDLMIRLPSINSDKITNIKTFASEREEELKESFELCAENIRKRQHRSKRNHDSKVRNTALTFTPNDRVLVRKFVTKNKIDDRYQAEIFEVIKQKEGYPLYIIKGLESGSIKTIHRDHLILFKQSDPITVQTTVNSLPTWDQTQTKTYEMDDDDEEEFSIKKQLNSKISIFYGDSDTLNADYTLIISNKIKEDELLNKLKDARISQQQTALITINELGSKCENIKILLRSIRKEISNKAWIKFVLATDNPTIYNSLIKLMYTYFPKTVIQKEKVSYTDSDDSSDDDDYIIQQPIVDVDVIDNQSSNSSSDSEGDDQDPPRYNLRRNARRPPNYMKDYVVHFLSQQ